MKINPYKHKERYYKWKESTKKEISKFNKKLEKIAEEKKT